MGRSTPPTTADDILDFALAGPKMRRWYNEEEEEGLEAVKRRRGGEGGDGEVEEAVERTQVLVLGGDTAMGDAVVMQLILAREEITSHVKNTAEVRTKYADYVRPLSVGLDSGAMGKALQGTKAVVCCGPVAGVPGKALEAGVGHLVCISVGEKAGGLGAMFGPSDAQLDAGIVEACVGSGVPTTVVKVRQVSNKPLLSALSFAAGGAGEGAVSREDVATAVARVVEAGPPASGVREVSISVAGKGMPDWSALDTVLA